MIPFLGPKPTPPEKPTPTIEGWLMGGPDDGRIVIVGREQTEHVTTDGDVYLRRPRVEDVIDPSNPGAPRIIAAWFDHIEYQEDDERFCPHCLAGMESSDHFTRCGE